jgi:L-2-hydroxyglutarate oxidase LhgO
MPGNLGATLVLNSPVLGGRIEDAGIVLEVGGVDPLAVRCKLFVNAAGLQAPPLARKLKGIPPNLIPNQYYAKGNYFSLSGKSPFSRLIYPVPVKGGASI